MLAFIRLVLSGLLAVLAATLPAGASPVAQMDAMPDRYHSLTMEHRHILREVLLKNSSISPAAVEVIEEGQAVPVGIDLRPIPADVIDRIPQMKARAYILVRGELLIVDTETRRVLDVVR